MFGCVERFLDPNYWLMLLMAVPGLLLGLTIHEYAHGWTAYKLGDPTAKALGRLTFNPLKHLSLFGTIAFFILGIAWSKPVPVNPENFKNPRKGMILVSIAGPIGSLITAIGFAIIFRLFFYIFPLFFSPTSEVLGYILNVLWIWVFYNVLLFFFNLLPIPPLDGSQIVFNLLPPRYSNVVYWLQRYGLVILVGVFIISHLLFPRQGGLFFILKVPTDFITNLLVGKQLMGIIG